MKPGRLDRCRRSPLFYPGLPGRRPALAGLLFLLFIAVGMLWTWAARTALAAAAFDASRMPGAAGWLQATETPAVPSPSGTLPAAGTPDLLATGTISATLQTEPVISLTPTLIPLPAITTIPQEPTSTAVLLSAGHPPAGTGFSKDPSPAWWVFLRRWSVPLILLGAWVGLAIWMIVSWALVNRASKR